MNYSNEIEMRIGCRWEKKARPKTQVWIQRMHFSPPFICIFNLRFKTIIIYGFVFSLSVLEFGENLVLVFDVSTIEQKDEHIGIGIIFLIQTMTSSGGMCTVHGALRMLFIVHHGSTLSVLNCSFRVLNATVTIHTHQPHHPNTVEESGSIFNAINNIVPDAEHI